MRMNKLKRPSPTPSPVVLIATITRPDLSEFRVYRKLHKSRPYYEIGTYAPLEDGGHRLSWINLRRFEVRPMMQALLEACKDMGLSTPALPREGKAEGY
jgi:hypothetical protein